MEEQAGLAATAELVVLEVLEEPVELEEQAVAVVEAVVRIMPLVRV